MNNHSRDTDEYVMFRDWFFKHVRPSHLVESGALLIAVLSLFLFWHQNNLMRDALSETQRQITNDSLHEAALDRPWVYSENLEVIEGFWPELNTATIKLVNVGRTVAHQLNVRACFDATFDTIQNFDSCRHNWDSLGPINMPPNGWAKMPKAGIPLEARYHPNFGMQIPRIYVYGNGTYDRDAGNKGIDSAGFEFCWIYTNRHTPLYGCKADLKLY